MWIPLKVRLPTDLVTWNPRFPLTVYANETTVGAALRKSGIKREDLYVTTKFGGGDVRFKLEESLRKVRHSVQELRPVFTALCHFSWG